MTIKYIIQSWIENGGGQYFIYGDFQDNDTNTYLSTFFDSVQVNDYDTPEEIKTALRAKVLIQAGVLGYSSFVDTDILDMYASGVPVRTTSALTLSLVGTGATGTRISTTKDSSVRVDVALSSASVLLGSAVSAVTLKRCATNSATEGDWTTVSIAKSGASGVAATVTDQRQITADIPAGWYMKILNTGTNSGIGSSNSATFVSAEKTIIG